MGEDSDWEEPPQGDALLKTIYIPKDLKALKDKLPESKYERAMSVDKITITKERKTQEEAREIVRKLTKEKKLLRSKLSDIKSHADVEDSDAFE